MRQVDNKIEAEVAAVSRINAVPSIHEVICRTTGMGFAAIARVTENRWIACAVHDEINFGLRAGEGKNPTDMRQIVIEAVEQVRPLIDSKRHQLTLHVSPETAIVVGDGKRLIQIMANLLNNAAKYTRDGGTIAISLM